MSIETMTDHEKSVVLARLCGWFAPAGGGFLSGLWKLDTGGNHVLDGFFSKSGEFLPDDFDLYAPVNMALAWRCIEWVTSPPKTLQMSEAALNTKFGYWWQGNAMWAETAADAQRAWLDKIMTLAIEAGMVEAAVSQEAS